MKSGDKIRQDGKKARKAGLNDMMMEHGRIVGAEGTAREALILVGTWEGCGISAVAPGILEDFLKRRISVETVLVVVWIIIVRSTSRLDAFATVRVNNKV